MGIPTWPGYTLYGADCRYFWPTGQTPKKLYISFQGIRPGASFPPSTFPCPNGIYRLEQLSGVPCTWEGYYGLGHIKFVMTSAGNDVDVWTPGAESAFTGNDGSNSAFWFANKLPPAAKFTGGFCQVSPRCSVYNMPTLQGCADLLGLPADKKTLAEFFPTDDGMAVFKYCRLIGHTNIKIKVDPSQF